MYNIKDICVFSTNCFGSIQMASKTMRNYYNKNALIGTGSYTKQLYFCKFKNKKLSLPSVFSMSKLPQKHVANQWVKSWDMLEAKNIKFKYQRGNSIRRIPGGSHKTKPNGDKKETSPTISTYCRTFFIVSVLPERQKRGTKRHG